jgi:hypothetical protein
MGHLAKEFPRRGHICICCKIVGHEVEDCPRIIAKVEKMSMNQQNKSILENQKEKGLEEVQTTLVQLKKEMNDHKYVSLPEIMKGKQCIDTRIGEFDIDCVLDEETQVNIMTKITWEILGKPTIVSSLVRIGLFKGKMITFCGRITNLHVIIHGTSTEEEFEVIKFVENSAPFPLLLGKTWIEKDQI